MSNQRTNPQIGFTILMFAVVVGVIFLIHSAMQGVLAKPSGTADMSEAAINARIAPVGQLNTGAPITPTAEAAAAAPSAASGAAPAAAPAAAARSGEDVFKTTCTMCHSSGAGGAPKFGDKAAWAPRIKQGLDVLVKHATEGFTGKAGMMPARGTCSSCSDAEIKNAVEYMVNHSK